MNAAANATICGGQIDLLATAAFMIGDFRMQSENVQRLGAAPVED